MKVRGHRGTVAPMGLTIAYTLRLARRDQIPDFLKAARAEARQLGWKARPARAGAAVFEALPHPKCEPVRLDFSASLTTDEVVKTSFAPFKTHVEVVTFLRALQPLAKSLKVDDECEFWETGDRALLKKHRAGFERAFSGGAASADEPPMTTTAYLVVDGKLVRAPEHDLNPVAPRPKKRARQR